MVILSTVPQLAPFRALVEKRLAESSISLKPTEGALLNLFGSKISFDRSAVVKGVVTTGEISSKKDLTLIDCPQLGSVLADRDVILIRCPDHGKVIAGRNVYCYDTEDSDVQSSFDLYNYIISRRTEQHYKHGQVLRNIKTFVETVYLVDYLVKGAIIFANTEGVPFKGRVIMDSRSKIEDLEHTNAEIIHVEDIIDHKDKEKSEESLNPSYTNTPNQSLSKKRKMPPESA